MNKWEKKLLINVDHGNDWMKFYSQSGLHLAIGYERVVIGKRGPYVEFSPQNIIWCQFRIPEHERFRVGNPVVYYTEWRSTDSTYVKLYHQQRTVKYADYRIGMCYISPFDLLRDELQPVILGEA